MARANEKPLVHKQVAARLAWILSGKNLSVNNLRDSLRLNANETDYLPNVPLVFELPQSRGRIFSIGSWFLRLID